MAFPASFVEISAPSIERTMTAEKRTRHFHVNWSDVDAALDEAFQQTLDTGTGFIYPTLSYPGKPWLRLQGVQVRPVEGQDNAGAVDTDGVATSPSGAFLDFAYETKAGGREGDQDDDDSSHRRMTLSLSLGAEMLRFPQGGRTVTWAATNADGSSKLTDDVVIHKVIPIESWEMDWPSVPFPHWDNFRTQIGTVNNAAFFKLEAETILFMGADANEGIAPVTGDSVWNLKMRFEVRRIQFPKAAGGTGVAGWNHIFRPDAKPGTDDPWQQTTPKIYQSSNFVSLFLGGSYDLWEEFQKDVEFDGEPPT